MMVCPEFGYVIERSGVHWDERFWIDIPSVGVRKFGSDERARIFFSKEEAEREADFIRDKIGCHCYITKRSDLYPSLKYII